MVYDLNMAHIENIPPGTVVYHRQLEEYGIVKSEEHQALCFDSETYVEFPYLDSDEKERTVTTRLLDIIST